MAQQHPGETNSTPSVVLIGVPHQKALDKVIQKLQNNNIKFTEFHEPDWDMGLSAVATTPNLNCIQRNILQKYSLWKEKSNVLHVD